jgi:hypothetical protein
MANYKWLLFVFVFVFQACFAASTNEFYFNNNVRILCLSCNVKKSESLSDLNKKERNKRHSSPFINIVKGVFFVVRVTLVPVSYLSAPSAGT